jgi:hypothetical protein
MELDDKILFYGLACVWIFALLAALIMWIRDEFILPKE